MTDPLAVFLEKAHGGRHPIPLVETSMEVEVRGGVAVVTTTRLFRNVESEPIEATMTFPVPTHATLFAVEARLDDRMLRARAQRRERARETYEAALDEGKTSVLHEEVLHGIHMLSVAPMRAGQEIEVVASWVSTLAYVGGRGELRIPLTVGHVYGRSPLPDSDALLHGGPMNLAALQVRCKDGKVWVRGRELREGETQVPLNAPVDLVVTGAPASPVHGRAADGRRVSLSVVPQPGGEQPLDLAVLVDRSGSMVRGKHTEVLLALGQIAPDLAATDRIDLWQFDNECQRIGTTTGVSLHQLLSRLDPPCGGTEVGGAIRSVVQNSPAKDVLLITDGNSYHLDVWELAQAGRRVTAVLIGEDSLDAHVGRLAALTGGECLVAAGADVADTLSAALGSLRMEVEAPEANADQLRLVRRNARIDASWWAEEAPAEGRFSRAVAALFAGLRLPALTEPQAAELAAAEGLVTHLTSLVLVDEVGKVQEGLPATRRVPLPEPAFMASWDGPAPRQGRAGIEEAARRYGLRPLESRPTTRYLRSFSDRSSTPAAPLTWQELIAATEALDWSSIAPGLAEGDVTLLPPPVSASVLRFADIPDVVVEARRHVMEPRLVIIGLIARAHADRHRSAARLARTILRNPAGNWLDRVESRLLRAKKG